MSTKHEEKALRSILRGETPEKRVMIGYESDKKEPSKDGKTIESPITKIMQEVRMPWFCPECKCVMKKRADDRYWRRHKMCLECWSKKETKMKIDGTWDEYQREQDELYRRSYVKDLKAELQGYIDMVSKDQDIAQDSGNLERWGMSDSSEIVETLSKEIVNIEKYLSDEITWEELSDGQPT